jgi:hypothetical protein
VPIFSSDNAQNSVISSDKIVSPFQYLIPCNLSVLLIIV